MNRFSAMGLNCICDSPGFELVFRYDKPPAGELSYEFTKNCKYYRELLRCDNCGHFRSIHDMPAENLYRGDYITANYKSLEGVSEAFNSIYSLEFARSDNEGRVGSIVGFIRENFAFEDIKNFRILDVGSGLGIFPYRMKSGGWEISSVEPDPLACEHMRQLGLDVIEGSFLEIQAGGDFNCITFNKVLEHIDNPLKFLRHGQHMLDNKGIVYVEVPDGTMASREGWHREEFFIEHVHVFSKESLSILMQKAGFIVVRQQRLREPSGKYTLRCFCRANR